ncbi:hypothetical protein [Allorhodopirellula heiligendammensis]|uniref:Uncharacterized protein n=1 Tax=Allorhodopirellula heiligendammensis TaxID=2714739 RepID=A0A5C6BD00_9BACT|nr:hypothetical protein [Allorhodopirellula heiligendammensis]TWU09928.1 hypothetical protein Poly21_52560 [Allorhodopirellula heiligendammensis]
MISSRDLVTSKTKVGDNAMQWRTVFTSWQVHVAPPFPQMANVLQLLDSIRTTAFIALTTLALGCSDRHVSIEQLPQTVVGVDVDTNEPRFVFVAPDGFDWNDEHRIWHNKTTRTSVTLAHAPGTTLQSVVDDFVADRMLPSGMELTEKVIRDVAGRPTLLVHGNRLNARYPQQFCTVAFGTTTGCAQITAIYPADGDEHAKQQIETSLLESRYEVPN